MVSLIQPWRDCVQVRTGVGVQGRPRVHGAAGARPGGVGVAAGAAAVLPGQWMERTSPALISMAFIFMVYLFGIFGLIVPLLLLLSPNLQKRGDCLIR